MRVFPYELPICPYYEKARKMPAPCNGELEFLGDKVTLLGTFWGVDRNDHREIWRCKKCERKFERSWKWKELST